MRLATSLRLSWRALRHHAFRYWLASATIAAAVATIHINLALTLRPLDRTAELIDRFQSRYLMLFDSLVTTVDARALDARAADLARAGVVARHDFLCGYFVADPDPIPLLLCSLASPRPPELAGLLTVTEGREPAPGAAELMVEAGLATRWHLAVGSSLTLFRNKPPLPVVGIYARNPQLATVDVLAPLGLVQDLKNRPGELSFALLELRQGLAVEPAQQAVARLFPDQRVLPAAVLAERLRAGGKPLRLAEGALAAVIASLCGLIAVFTLFSAVNERLRDFAVMRALGIARGAIAGQVMVEGLMLGLNGALHGLIIGEALLIAVAPRLHPVLGGASRWQECLLPLAMGVGVALLGALLPAIKACRAQPHDLLRA